MAIDSASSNGDQDCSEVRELTGFVDELISATIAKRTADTGVESTVSEPVKIDPPAAARRPNGSRASMSDDLLALFRSTEPPNAPPADSRVPNHAQPSPYLTRYLRHTEPSPELAPSGLAALDEHLGGGFGPGLHLLQGRPGAGKSAFLQSMTLEAVSLGRPVRYYALREGSLGTWERLVSSFSHILGGPAIPLSALRAHALTPDELEALADIDLALAESVLPLLSLIETVPADVDDLWDFVEDVRSAAAETGKWRRKAPLVLVDDLESLLLLTGARPIDHLFSRLDDALRAEAIPCLIALVTPNRSDRSVESFQAQTRLTLVSASVSNDGFSRGQLEVAVNAATGWTGTLPLLLDRDSGVFA
jgi:hypothetical protein